MLSDKDVNKVVMSLGENPSGSPNAARNERERLIAKLRALYEPHSRLTPAEKDLAKTIISLESGFDGTEAKCCECGKVGSIENDLTVHHKDHIESHNDLSNLDVAHTGCNTAEENRRRSRVADLRAGDKKRERASEKGKKEVSDASADAEPDHPPTSDETWRHGKERRRWNTWIHSPTGPFQGKAGGSIRRSDLSEAAVHACAMGSSITYERYIKEDIRGNIFKAFEEDGIKFVRYLGDNGVRPI